MHSGGNSSTGVPASQAILLCVKGTKKLNQCTSVAWRRQQQLGSQSSGPPELLLATIIFYSFLPTDVSIYPLSQRKMIARSYPLSREEKRKLILFSCSEPCQKCLEDKIKSEINQNLEQRDKPDLPQGSGYTDPCQAPEVQALAGDPTLGRVLGALLSQDLTP